MVEDAIHTMREISDQRTKSAVAAMQKGHNVMSANMIRDAATLNDAIKIMEECYDRNQQIHL